MYQVSPRRQRHRKRLRNTTPIPQGMFFVPYGQAPPIDGGSSGSSSGSSSSDSEGEDEVQVAKKMLAELRSLRKTTETLLTRQRDLQQKLEKHIKESPAKPPIKKTTLVKKATPIKKAAPVKMTLPAKKPARAARLRGPPPVVVSRLPKKDVTQKHKKVTKNHVVELIASQPGYGSSRGPAGYEKLIGLARKEVETIQTAMGTPGKCTETFGSESVKPHRLNARTSLERAALSDVTPQIDLTACQDSWASDYVLRRVWDGARGKSRRDASVESEGSDSAGRASRVPEVRSES